MIFNVKASKRLRAIGERDNPYITLTKGIRGVAYLNIFAAMLQKV
jgi:hypothetical protein